MNSPNKSDRNSKVVKNDSIARSHDRNYAAALTDDDFDAPQKIKPTKIGGGGAKRDQGGTESVEPLKADIAGLAEAKPDSATTANSQTVEAASSESYCSGSGQPHLAMPAAPKLHSFSPSVARIYGLEAAIVYQHIKWVCFRKGKYEVTKDRLLEIFPYLGRDQLVSALAKLLKPRKICEPALIERTDEKVNPTYRLRVSSTNTRKLHSFDPEIALKYGIAAAVVYDDLLRWIVKNDETSEGDLEPTHYESPAQWASSHPYVPLHTVKRAFRSLRDNGYLICREHTRARVPVWTIPLGQGRMDRWKQLHRYERKEKVNKNKQRVIYVPVLADEDCCEKTVGNRQEQNPSSGEQNPSSQEQMPSSGEQNPSFNGN